jgi:hypothetical protein
MMGKNGGQFLSSNTMPAANKHERQSFIKRISGE